MASDQETNPTEYGRRLIPSIIDELATSSPGFVFAQIPRSSQFADGLIDVTIKTFAGAIDRAAFWIESLVGKSDDSSVIAYLGPNDLRYLIIAVAARKVGYQTLLSSPRNSIEGHLSLFEHTNCHTVISDSGTKVDELLIKRPMRHFTVPALLDCLNEGPATSYPYQKSFEEGALDPFVVIHTSGSTGLPKPITVRLGSLATIDAQNLLPPFEGYDPQIKYTEGHIRVFPGLPPYHIAGLMQTLAAALYYNQTIIWPPSNRPMSSELIDDLLDNVSVDVVLLAPSILEEISQSQSSLEKLRKLKAAAMGGGPLSETAGNIISKYTKVLSVIGSSESCFEPTYHKDPKDWIYFHFDPKTTGIQFREYSAGVYEQFFVRDPSTDPYYAIWYTFPDRNEISTQDLFSKHPSKPNLWKYVGRSDDLLIFSNGEKYNPTAAEGILRSHPSVKGVVVVGHARFQPAALIELKGDPPQTEEAKQELLDSFKPYVASINDRAPGFAKLRRTHATFTRPDKPMLRTDKGTVKRAATVKLYEKEIDKLYADAEASTSSISTVKLDIKDQAGLTKALRHMLIATIGLQDLAVDEDIFAAGADSLQVMNLTRQLKASLSGNEGGFAADSISSRIIYSHPTATKLAKALQGMANQTKNDEESGLERVREQEEMLAKYTKQEFTVVLTGSTGSLGSYLLDCLLSSPRVSKVICLNRGHNGEERQKTVNISRGLISEWEGRATFLGIELGKPHLGLDDREYDLLVNEASVILHNQWQVDFNLSLASFEPHIAGVRDLIHLSSKSPHHPPILFTSSIATLGNWALKHPGENVPETAFHDFSIPSPIGYAESKYVAERMLEAAAGSHGVSSAICRVGQLGGPVEKKKGVWSKQEWFPSLIASSHHLRKLPTSLPGQDTIPWLPVDLTARILTELLFSDIDDPPPTTTTSAWTLHHNIINPTPGSWTSLLPTITAALSASGPVEMQTVGFAEWVEALRDSGEAGGNGMGERGGNGKGDVGGIGDVNLNPAIKLLDWFEGMGASAGAEVAELHTRASRKRSGTLGGVPAVGEGWMGVWLGQWGF